MLLYAGGGIENEQVRQYIVQQGGEEIERRKVAFF